MLLIAGTKRRLIAHHHIDAPVGKSRKSGVPFKQQKRDIHFHLIRKHVQKLYVIALIFSSSVLKGKRSAVYIRCSGKLSVVAVRSILPCPGAFHIDIVRKHKNSHKGNGGSKYRHCPDNSLVSVFLKSFSMIELHNSLIFNDPGIKRSNSQRSLSLSGTNQISSNENSSVTISSTSSFSSFMTTNSERYASGGIPAIIAGIFNTMPSML